jgi:hypothetical protein
VPTPLTVTDTDDLAANLSRFWDGALPTSPYHEVFLDLLQRGRNFVCSPDRSRMAPSRFVGYSGNTLAGHSQLDGKDGGITDAAIKRVLGKDKAPDGRSERAYRRICASVGLDPERRERKYWVLSEPISLASVPPAEPGSRVNVPLAAQLNLPAAHEARMREIIATSARLILDLRPKWYRARRDRTTHLRIFCGRLIVATLEERYVWLALDESVIGNTDGLRSWSWDDAAARPKDAVGQPYPRYVRPPSRNGFYDPAKDPGGTEWRTIQAAHHYFLRRAASHGVAPNRRTESDPGIPEQIARWRLLDGTEVGFNQAVKEALDLDPEARRGRLAIAPRRPEVRTTTVVVFSRNADVVAEVLHRAAGKCELCKQPAPFQRVSDGSPYLEVHHRIRLADEGDDTVENAVALCPNCHRKQHFGGADDLGLLTQV